LGRKGYGVETAATGRDALEKAQGRFFNLALLDIKLPDMEGVELLEPLKKSHPDMVKIMVTAYASVETAIDALNKGASAYITKPLNMDEVLARVRDTLEKQHLVAENRRLVGDLQQELAERKRAEEALRKQSTLLIQSEKMSAVGTLAAGIAHELNNPMMGMLNFTEYCLKHTERDDPRYRVLQNTERETKRCIAIVENLLTFSHMEREGEEAYRQGSLAMILDRVFQLLTYRIEKERVSVTQHFAEGLPDIWMKTSSMQQVFLNLISNALDAVKEREKKEICIDVCCKGEFIEATVADSGCGIDRKDLGRVFDPFFTTKPVGQGTGLGLAIGHSIVQAHGGEMKCESELGAGTKFTILLPIERRKERENP